MKYLDDLVFWVTERERVRKAKESGLSRPWTSDHIMDTYRFCNVRREDDRVTKWIHNNWLYPRDGAITLPFAMAVARLVNLPETLAELGYPDKWDAKRFVDVLSARKNRGEKVWTSAYMITGGFSKGGETKEVIIARVLTRLHDDLKARHPRPGISLSNLSYHFMVPGIGTFLSAQIVADLKWSQDWRGADDWWTWCSPGPGSTMGLNFLHDRPTTTAIGPTQFIKEVNQIREILHHAGFDLCAQNTQNCLCEFSKYVRGKHLGMRLKTTYKPY